MTNTPHNNYQGDDLVAMNNVDNYHNWIIDKIEDYLGPRVLEIGAGSGTLTELILKRNSLASFRLLSLEPSQEMYPLLKNRIAKLKDDRVEILQAYSCDQTTLIKEFNPTSIIYNNVLEHIENDQEELNLAYGLLAENGYLLKYSPALNWLMSDFDKSIGHYRRYGLKEASTKVTNAKFTIVKKQYIDSLGIIPWFIVFKLLKLNLSPGNASAYDKFIVPVLKKFEPDWVPFGKNVLIIAKK